MASSSPKPLRLLTAFFVLLTAIVLQSWLSLFGVYGNIVLAVLITFSFLFDIWELVAFVLLGVFLMNWLPGPSPDIAVFALIPLAVRGARALIRPDLWIGSAAAIVLGIFLFYLCIAPGTILTAFGSFLIDIVISLACGEIVLWGMENN